MNCQGEIVSAAGTNHQLIVLAGQPNVGKSVLFKQLTGRYTMVSNYPGTTIEVARGRATFGGGKIEIVDAPGINTLAALAEDERVTRSLLLQHPPGAVIQVADA